MLQFNIRVLNMIERVVETYKDGMDMWSGYPATPERLRSSEIPTSGVRKSQSLTRNSPQLQRESLAASVKPSRPLPLTSPAVLFPLSLFPLPFHSHGFVCLKAPFWPLRQEGDAYVSCLVTALKSVHPHIFGNPLQVY